MIPSVSRPERPAHPDCRGGGWPGLIESLSLRSSWPLWLALATAVVAVAVAWHHSRNLRLANLDTARCGFDQTFLMFSKSGDGRGYLTDRAGSTVRRADRGLGSRSWQLERFSSGPSSPDSWFVHSKSFGATFLLPVEDVGDWVYPFLYGFVRAERPALELPAAAWVQLHVNRVFSGLYLRVDLPFDVRKRDGGSGVRREILTVEGDQLRIVDTRLDPAARLFHDLVASGMFPHPAPAPAALAWLDERRPTEERILLLDNEEPWALTALPLPMSVAAASWRLRGRPLEPVVSDGFARWSAPGGGAATPQPFTADELARLGPAFARYRRDLELALVAHQTLRDSSLVPAGWRLELPAELGGSTS